MLAKTLAISTLTAFVILSALLQSTTPSTVHPFGILMIFVLLYVLALGVLTFCLYGCWQLVARLTNRTGPEAGATLQRAYYFSSVLALAPVMLVGIRSIGRTGVYDTTLVIVFETIACFYIARRR
jgi:hypothetical protein